VAHGTVFLHFPTKGTLLAAAILEPLDELERLSAMTAEAPALDEITRVISAQVSFVARRPDYFRLVSYVLGVPDRFPPLAARLTDFGLDTASRLSTVVARGQRSGELEPGDPRATAVAYLAFLQGLAVTVREDADHRLWPGVTQVAMRLFAPRRRPTALLPSRRKRDLAAVGENHGQATARKRRPRSATTQRGRAM
jgi:AcrR family transcriptional regulator